MGSDERKPFVVRVYGDSLAMPRAELGVDADSTYAELLKHRIERTGPKVVTYNRSRGGQTISSLFEDFARDAVYFGQGSTDLIVLQFGIVDCAPRPIPGWARAALARMPFRVRRPIVRFLHDNRRRILGSGIRWRLTSPRRFRKTLERWVDKAAREARAVAVIDIAPTTPAIEAHSPGLSDSIALYDGIIAGAVKRAASDKVRLISVHGRISDEGGDGYTSAEDGHHITPQGHELYASMLWEELASPLGLT